VAQQLFSGSVWVRQHRVVDLDAVGSRRLLVDDEAAAD
jgi:hypothetical protein